MYTSRLIGLMSGTSLDGLDIVDVVFEHNSNSNNKWEYKILAAQSYPYPESWKDRLANASNLSGLELSLLDSDYGYYVGKLVQSFMIEYNSLADAIAMHGHTVFHQPEKKLSLQIGSGAAVAAITKLPVICKFRDKDVFLGGQGAPLVPIGDRLLFGQYSYCLNLGGIANISYENQVDNKRIAFDICPCNMALNYLASLLKLDMDTNGQIAKEGSLNTQLLNSLNSIAFYKSKAPKSLGKEWYEINITPILSSYILEGIEIKNLLHTFSKHIAAQISANCKNSGSMLISGGGAYNKFLIECIASACPNIKIEIPQPAIIEYKEALIFALLGVLRLRGEANCFASVTGAESDHSSGCIFI